MQNTVKFTKVIIFKKIYIKTINYCKCSTKRTTASKKLFNIIRKTSKNRPTTNKSRVEVSMFNQLTRQLSALITAENQISLLITVRAELPVKLGNSQCSCLMSSLLERDPIQVCLWEGEILLSSGNGGGSRGEPQGPLSLQNTLNP